MGIASLVKRKIVTRLIHRAGLKLDQNTLNALDLTVLRLLADAVVKMERDRRRILKPQDFINRTHTCNIDYERLIEYMGRLRGGSHSANEVSANGPTPEKPKSIQN